MGNGNRGRYLSDEDNVSVEPFGRLARYLLTGQCRFEPTQIWLLHGATTSFERDEVIPLGKRKRPPDVQTAVWLRVVWPNGEESLGFVSCRDAERVAAFFPELARWLSRLRAPLTADDPTNKRRWLGPPV